METFLLYPNAKLNLSLKIIGRQADGYHTLESIFVPVNITDSMEVSITTNTNKPYNIITSNIDQDIACRAAHIALDIKGITGYHIAINTQKHIPISAGLGGGSANAAAVIKLLERITGDSTLHSIAKSIGADVPFFLHNRPAFVTGIGERFTPINCGELKLYVLILYPGFGISTKQVYEALNYPINTITQRPITQENYLEMIYSGTNDLYQAALLLAPELIHVISIIENTPGCVKACMSGSGSTCFGIYTNFENLVHGYDLISKKLQNTASKIWTDTILV